MVPETGHSTGLLADLWWWLRTIRRRRHCPHMRLDPIYGDEINHVGGWRLQCRACRRFFDGPVDLAAIRNELEK
jgi:hypothetical protein